MSQQVPNTAALAIGRARRRIKTVVWRQMGLALAILVCGIILGSAGTLTAARNLIRNGLQQPDKMAGNWTQRMSAQLNLTPEQQEKVCKIVSKHFRRVWDVRRQEMSALHDEVAAVLTPEQAAQWTESLRNMGTDRGHGLGPYPPRDQRQPPRNGFGTPSPQGHSAAPGSGDTPRRWEQSWF